MSTEQTTQTAEVTKEVKGRVGFGIDQISNPTPKWASWLVRTLIWATGIFAVLVDSPKDLIDLGISEHAASVIVMWAVKITATMSVLKQFTGVGVEKQNKDLNTE